MLTKMYLTNFLSFVDRTEFDFTASKYSILEETNVYEGILKGAGMWKSSTRIRSWRS